MVRKVIALVSMLALIFAYGVTAQAATHTIYENGNLGSTYVAYFKDILSGAKFTDDYVAFRSGQYSYTMVVGDISFNESNKTFTLNGEGTEYVFATNNSNYNAQYTYTNKTINNFSLTTSDEIIYSNLGQFPQLIDRGTKYEMLLTLLICIMLLGFVIRFFFHSR